MMEQSPDDVPARPPLSTLQRLFADGRAPLIWGVLWGVIQAAAPLGFWWLDAATVYGMSIALIAAVYIGFAVADGRPGIWSGRPGESHPRAPTERSVTVSRHSALLTGSVRKRWSTPSA